MAKIFRTSDRIPVKIDTITVTVAPLTFDQKTELQTVMLSASKDPMNAVRGARLAVKYAVKKVDGLEDMDGVRYDVELGEDGLLTDDSVDTLLNMQEYPKLIAVCSQLISGIPQGIVDPSTGKAMAGVSMELVRNPKPKARK
jgi:hypothetical protein